MKYFLLHYVLCIIFELPLLHYYHLLSNKLKNKKTSFFGIFVTIFRYNDKKKVHGCIGYYNTITQSNMSSFFLNNTDIIYHVKNCAYKAAFRDNRSSHYPSLIQDPDAVVELSFMENIQSEENFHTIFDPLKHGIIVYDTITKNTATFLPNVFTKNDTLDYIKTLLIEKLNNKQESFMINDNYVYYYYTTQCVLTNTGSLLFDTHTHSYNHTLYTIIGSFFNTFYTEQDKTPLYIHDDIISYDKQDNIRNISIDTYLYTKHNMYINSTLKNMLSSKLNYIFKHIKPFSLTKLQYYSFLLNDKSIINKDTKKELCHYLYTSFYENEHVIEPIFTYPEIIVSLKNNCLYTIHSDIIINLFKNCLEKEYDNVFYINWVIQVFVSYNDIYTIYNDVFVSFYITTIKKKIKLLDTLETNEIAVLFECGCALLSLNITHVLLKKYIFIVYIYLQRYRFKYTSSYDGFYYFKNNKIRIDITFHILNGLSYIH